MDQIKTQNRDETKVVKSYRKPEFVVFGNLQVITKSKNASKGGDNPGSPNNGNPSNRTS